MQKFVEECRDDIGRFQRPIKMNPIRNFASEIFKRKGSSRKIVDEVKHERNILGQIVCLAMRNSISLESILSFPLTTVSHSLSNYDGSMIQSGKGELVSLLRAKAGIEQTCSSGHDVEIIDGFHLLTCLRDSPPKYGLFASFILKLICKTAAHKIHIFFDNAKSPSLRELNLKAKEELVDSWPLSVIQIIGENQERAASLAKCLLHHDFREELVKFLIKHWTSSEIKEILGEKRVFVSFNETCHIFSKEYEPGKTLISFNNYHFEVESKMIFHLNEIPSKNILVRTFEHRNRKKC